MEDVVEIIDLNGEVVEISPYDSNYPVQLLANGLKKTISQAQTAVGTIYKEVAKASPVIAEAQKAMKESSRYVVDMSDELMKAIDQGAIKLQQNKDGKLYA